MQTYSTNTKGTKGRIKQRISDFKVKEITKQGETCKISLNENAESNAKLPEIKEKPDREKSQLHLQMEKFNLDQHNATKKLSRFIGISKKRIGYAGMKDKRAITSQKISIFNPNTEKLQKFNSKFIKLSKPEWKKERIELGDLKGNKFEITIRNIEIEEKELKKTITECFKEMKKGIANYFGEQRFGGIRNITHKVGKQFIKKEFKKAIMQYLTFTNEKEEESIRTARKNLEQTNDFGKALKEFPIKYRYERSILQHLTKYPNDYIGAFRNIPKTLQFMFVHAYQSYLFNKIIEERIKQGIGLKTLNDDELIEKKPTAALLGFESKIPKGKQGEIEKKILKEEQVSLKEFHIKEFPELSSKGTRKSIILFPEKLRLLSIEKDEFNENKLKATLSFSLEKGNYATTVLREIMKND